LKPENVLQRRSENNHQARKPGGGNNYVRSLELKSKRVLTTGMFNLVVKDPITTRARRTLSEHDDTPLGRVRLSSKPFKHIAIFAVLSTFVHLQLTEMHKGAPDLAGKLPNLRTRATCRSSMLLHDFRW